MHLSLRKGFLPVPKKSYFINTFWMAQGLLINILESLTSDTSYNVKNDDLGEITTTQISVSPFHLQASMWKQ